MAVETPRLSAAAGVGRRRFLVGLFVSAVAIRAAGLGTPPLGDEAITLRVVRNHGSLELLTVIPLTQPHAPGYYVLLDLWGQVLPLETARWWSIAAGAAVPVVAYSWLRDVLDERRARLAAAVLAFAPPLVVQAGWLRMYALLTLAVLVSWVLAWRYLHGDSRLFHYGLAAGSAIALHPFAVAAVGAQLAWLALEQSRTEWRPWFRPVAATIALAGAVSLAGLLARVAGLAGVYNISDAAMHIQYADRPLVRLAVLPLTTVTGTGFTTPVVVALLAVTALLVWRLATSRVWETRIGRLGLAWVCGSLAILCVGHAIRPVLMLKYVCWLAPGIVVLLALAIGDGLASEAAVSGLAGVFAVNGTLALFGAHVAMVAIWEGGVLEAGAL